MNYRTIVGTTLILMLTGCGGEEPTIQEPAAQQRAEAARESDVAVPLGQDPTPEEMERERLSDAWRRLQSFRESLGPTPSEAEAEAAETTIEFAEGEFRESLDAFEPSTIDELPVQVPIRGDVAGPSVLRSQVLLGRAGFSPGVIDGRWGKNTAIAAYWFQKRHGLEPSGEIDRATFQRLVRVAGRIGMRSYSLTSDDVGGQFTSLPEDPYEKAKLECLCYESPLEKIAEKFHVTPELLRQLNPQLRNGSPSAGMSLWVPNVKEPLTRDAPDDIRRIRISVGGNYLHGFNEEGTLLYHAPITVGSEYDPSPSERLKLVGIAFDPDFHYQPKLFHEVPDEEPDVMMPAGPNSPVGVVWMELNKPHYGIHGTAAPETIGYASSHGCIRLTNWNALELAHRASTGIPVEFVDPR